MTPSYEIPPRSQWLRLWSAMPATSTKALAVALADRYRVEDLELPRSGLGLLPLTDSALGDDYFIGEIPLAQAHVRLSDNDAGCAEGAATLLDDRAGVARALAVLDAVVAAGWPGRDEAVQLLAQGSAALTEQARQRQALLLATRVDFTVLGAAGEDDDE